MKNLKTIITLLVLTMAMFSCQTNDELEQIEELTIENKFSKIVSRTLSTTSLLIEWDSGVSSQRKRQIIDEFEQEGVVFIGSTICIDDAFESWEIEEISFERLFVITFKIKNGYYPPTGVAPTGEDPYPIDLGEFIVSYDYNCSGPLK